MKTCWLLMYEVFMRTKNATSSETLFLSFLPDPKARREVHRSRTQPAKRVPIWTSCRCAKNIHAKKQNDLNNLFSQRCSIPISHIAQKVIQYLSNTNWKLTHARTRHSIFSFNLWWQQLILLCACERTLRDTKKIQVAPIVNWRPTRCARA